MIGQNKERWRELCQQVAVEQDPKKLVELTTEIHRHLEEMRRRLMDATPPEIFKLNPLALFVFWLIRTPHWTQTPLLPLRRLCLILFDFQRHLATAARSSWLERRGL